MKTKSKGILGITIIVLLLLSFFIGSDYKKEENVSSTQEVASRAKQSNVSLEGGSSEEITETPLIQTGQKAEAQIPVENASGEEKKEADEQTQESSKETLNESTKAVKEKESNAQESRSQENKSQVNESQENKSQVNESQENKSEVQANSAEATEKNTLVCKFSISCSTLLNHMDELEEGKKQLVGDNGVVLAETEVNFEEGDTVFDILQKLTKENKIHLEFVSTPVYNSVYIEGINNLYEFDCGDLSGWMYKVNDSAPEYGCNLYEVQPGDKIEWLYTCDLGRDVKAGIEGEGEK